LTFVNISIYNNLLSVDHKMRTSIRHQSIGEEKTPFSHVVKDAVDKLNIRDYYKGNDDLRIAKYVRALMRTLFANHKTAIENDQDANTEATENKLILKKQILFLPQEITTQSWIEQLYRQLPKIIINSPNISPVDRMLCQTVLDLLVELQFNIYDDTQNEADSVTEFLTTTRVPDRDQVRHYIDKKEGSKDMSRVGRSWRGNIEEIRGNEVKNIPGDFGIDSSFKEMLLYRIIENGVNKLSHTAFEYFHRCDEIETNREKMYLVRVYTHKDTTTKARASIIALLDKNYNFLNPTFPVMDDSESNQFIINNIWWHQNVWHFSGWVFFRYKGQLILIKKWRYAFPSFVDQVSGKTFISLKPTPWGFELKFKECYLYTNSYFSVLGESMEEVEELMANRKKK